MTSKPTRSTKGISKTRSTDDQTQSPTTRNADQTRDAGTPIEHYHGEPTGKHIADEGDLEEETLAQSAPFNKTYGRKAE